MYISYIFLENEKSEKRVNYFSVVNVVQHFENLLSEVHQINHKLTFELYNSLFQDYIHTIKKIIEPDK